MRPSSVRPAQRLRSWKATPIVPRPAWVPMTGPIWPTTISPSVERAQLVDELVDVVAVGVEHGEVLDARRRTRRPCRRGRRAPCCACAACRAARRRRRDLDDRLDRQRRGEQRLGVADAAALLEVVERVEGAEDPRAADERRVASVRRRRRASSPAAAACSAQARAIVPSAERHRAAVDDARRRCRRRRPTWPPARRSASSPRGRRTA